MRGTKTQESTIMAFVNEMISAEDRKKYGLDELDSSQAMRGKSPQRNWTIDHERDIYLRNIGRGREESSGWSKWHFYWRGELMTVCLEVADSGSDGTRDGHGWVRYQLVECYRKGFFIPEPMLGRRDEIISDLREAFASRKGGIYSTKSSYEVTLTI
jgi:hypothetical protein